MYRHLASGRHFLIVKRAAQRAMDLVGGYLAGCALPFYSMGGVMRCDYCGGEVITEELIDQTIIRCLECGAFDQIWKDDYPEYEEIYDLYAPWV